MSTEHTTTASAELRGQVRGRYAALARQAIAGPAGSTGPGDCGCGHPAGCGCAGTCCDTGGESLGSGTDLYDAASREAVPETALLASMGCGNPTAVAELAEGETVLDLGSGGGIDVLLSARRVGSTGTAYGLDMTNEMLALARRNAAEAGATNVHFLKGQIEAIPLPADTIDVIISNCVINLSTDKPAVLAEMFRVLATFGRIGISDIVAEDRLSPQERAERGSYVGCIAGALSKSEYETGLAEAGFTGIEVSFTHEVADGLHGAIIRATKPTDAASVPAGGPARLPVAQEQGCC
jgi:arsenite methyltransferase